MVHRNNTFNVSGFSHPNYIRDAGQWRYWRDTFEGGDYYRQRYLLKFSERETDPEFATRKGLTPIPTFAKAAIIDMRNSIYQRLVEVTRTGGSNSYQDAVIGTEGGVDGRGGTMDSFIGKDVLTELLLMGKVGVYVDAAPQPGLTLADQAYPPYLTYYRREDIVNLVRAERGEGGEFTAVYLRDWGIQEKTEIGGVALPTGTTNQYRLVYKDKTDGKVYYKLFDSEEKEITTAPVPTGLTRVPFVLFDIGESLMKDVASYQSAILNMVSSDVYYAIKSNSTFLTIQKDSYGSGDHLKQPETGDGGKGHAETSGGGGQGRYYGIGEDRPQFIGPPTENLEVSMALQDRLQDSIRELVNLAVTNKAGSRTESAEAKKVGTQGLENGLAFIGMVLEQGEKLIAAMWAEYENTENPNPAVVAYPDRYILKEDEQRLDEADRLTSLAQKLPGKELKKTVTKQVVVALLSGKIPQENVDSILREVDNGKYLIGLPQDVFQAHKDGLVDTITASDQLGYDGDEVVEQAKKDRAERIAATLAAQTPKGEGNQNDGPPGATNPASRGAPELDINPQSGSTEKDEPKEPEE